MDLRLLLGVAGVCRSGLRVLGRHRYATLVGFVLAVAWLVYGTAARAAAHGGTHIGPHDRTDGTGHGTGTVAYIGSLAGTLIGTYFVVLGIAIGLCVWWDRRTCLRDGTGA